MSLLRRIKNYKPCFGFFLQGAVKWVAISDMALVLLGNILLIFSISKIYTDWQKMWTDMNYRGYYVRLASWLGMSLHFCLGGFTGVFLYRASFKRNIVRCKIWQIFHLINHILLLFFYWFNVAQFGLKITPFALFMAYFTLKLYTSFVVYAFMREIRLEKVVEAGRRGLTEIEVVEFEEGKSSAGSFISTVDVNNVNTTVLEEASAQPYKKDTFEIPAEELTIDEDHPLGEGAYGMVYKGHLKLENSVVIAAVKTIQPDSDVMYFKALLDELKVMTHIGKHENIVNLLGACTSEIRDKKLLIVVEFCALGSLKEYLRSCRGLFNNHVKNGQIIADRNMYENADSEEIITTKDQIRWCYEAAKGMEYLVERKVIHGDLAARNILLTSKRSLKIADFGLSRQLYMYAVYVKRGNVPLPWRWLALESLVDMIFSHQSDVWAYGISIWEIFTLSETPYPDFAYSLDFVKKLRNGLRLLQPFAATDTIYDLMKDCWTPEPQNRPTFSDISFKFKKMLEFHYAVV